MRSSNSSSVMKIYQIADPDPSKYLKLIVPCVEVSHVDELVYFALPVLFLMRLKDSINTTLIAKPRSL